ncbi:MAG TPA: carbonic anhydrase [bacterium]
MKAKIATAVFGTMLGIALPLCAEEARGVAADEALARLMDGNRRFVEMKLAHPEQDVACRTTLAKGQQPFAVILGCSDSRVPPEVIFDQGLGDLFVVRVAGNVADDIGIASMEYAVEHLGSRLIVVLGHERCGAVTAAVKGGELPGHLPALMAALKPAVEKARGGEGDAVEAAVAANVAATVALLRESKPILAEMVEKGEIRIVGARYDLDSGEVALVR